MFNPAEEMACRRLIEIALEEDLGGQHDLTSHALIPDDILGNALLVSRAPGVLAGLPAVGLILEVVDPRLALAPLISEGEAIYPGSRLGRIRGPMRSLLTAERTALNFVQHLSGVATLTRKFVNVIAGLPSRIVDTRKTLPGWRLLEKYAVRTGGGANHRMGLFDGILIKDNHLAALGGDVVRAVAMACAYLDTHGAFDPAYGPEPPMVEIEVDTLAQLDAALTAHPHGILLDNMTLDELREAVRRRNEHGQGTFLEASGGVTLETIRAVAEAGVDRIAIGALTHSAPALDIGLDYETSSPLAG